MKTNSFGNFIITKIPTPLCQLQSITEYPRLASILASFESTKHSGRITYTSFVIFLCRNFVLTFILPYPINETLLEKHNLPSVFGFAVRFFMGLTAKRLCPQPDRKLTA